MVAESPETPDLNVVQELLREHGHLPDVVVLPGDILNKLADTERFNTGELYIVRGNGYVYLLK